MEKVLEFLQEAKTFYVATVEDGAPKVRPFGFVMEYDGKICMCTADGKNTSKQLKKCPSLEVSAAVGKKYIRINGKAEFMGEDARKKHWKSCQH